MSFQMHTPGVRTYADGREVCDASAAGIREYDRRREAMRERQGWRCAIGGEFISDEQATFDHERSRGGGKQDDRIEVDGRWRNAAVCCRCNGIKGSRRYEWRDGLYLPTGVTK